VTSNAGDRRRHIALARQHVTSGRAIIARQRRLIEELRGQGHSTDRAEQMLDRFTQCQTIFEEHLTYLLKQKT